MDRVSLAQGRTFACLQQLRELHIDAIAEQDDDELELLFSADLEGLPAALQTLEAGLQLG